MKFLRLLNKWSGFLLCLILLLQFNSVNAQFLVGNVNSENLTACNGDSTLTATITAGGNPTAGGVLTVNLANGVEYVPNSVTTVSTSGGTVITIVEDDISNLNQPTFTIAPNSIAVGSQLNFSISRRANCDSRTFALGGGVFSDQVVFSDGTNTSSASSVSPYTVTYPALAIIQPAAQSGVLLNQSGTRTFRIVNGADGCADSITISLVVPENLEHEQLQIGATILTPISTNTSGGQTTYQFVIEGANLGSGNELCNGEFVEFTETFKPLSCVSGTTIQTTYTASWGCGPNQCETISGNGVLNIATGNPSFQPGDFSAVKVGYVNMCNDFQLQTTYNNSGAGNPSASGMFNIAIRIGEGNSGFSPLYGDLAYFNLTNHSINGVNVPVSAVSGPTNMPILSLEDVFTSDPDGSGVGLEDLDGDGFFDDLPGGNTLTLLSNVSIDCSSSASCGAVSTVYPGVGADLTYTTYCDTVNRVQSNSDLDQVMNYRREAISEASYFPANIENGVPFSVRLGKSWYGITSDLLTANTKYVYTITLPAGMTIQGSTVQYVNGQYPSVSTPQTVTYSQVGNVITVISPGDNLGYLLFDLVYDCAVGGGETNPTVTYEIEQYSDYPSCATCPNNGFACGSVSVQALCPGACPLGGVSTGIPKIERNDNSLGWTDPTMTSIQSRSNISDYDLSKCLYLDEFNLSASGRQNGAATNLGARFNVDKSLSNANTISVLTADIRIKRGGVEIVNETGINVFSLVNSTATEQIVDWDFTAFLPVGGLLDGDSIFVVSNYQLITNDLAYNDVMVGNTWQLYNSSSPSGTPVWQNSPISCNVLVPELYFAGTLETNASNNWRVSACTPSNIGSNMTYLARRFNSSGYKYQSEYRPGTLIKKYYVRMPKTFIVNSVEYLRIDPYNATPQPVNLVSVTDEGTYNLYEYDPPAGINHFDVTVLNNYGAYFRVNVTATCESELGSVEANRAYSYIDATDFYYHAAAQPLIPDSLNRDSSFVYSRRIDFNNKPDINLINQSGTIQLTQQDGSWVVRMENPTAHAAPYTWIAIPDVTGVSIVSVDDVAASTALVGTPYPGGTLYQISSSGLNGGAFTDYRINFNTTRCIPTTVKVFGGWNCAEFPSSLSDYTCGPEELDLQFIPQSSEIEVIAVSSPVGVQPLCDTLTYEFQYNSAGAGNTVNPQFGIVPLLGLQIIPLGSSQIEVEYPAGSGNLDTLTGSLNAGVYVFDLSTHSAYPPAGLPGTLTDGGDANTRLMNIKFKALTDCDFISGSQLNVIAFGESVCGNKSSGNGVRQSTPAINIDGATSDYGLVGTLDTQAGSSFNTCGSNITLELTNTFVTSTVGSETTANAQVHIKLPTGYVYVANSFANNASASPSHTASVDSVVTNGLNEQIIYINVPQGMNTSGNSIAYTIDVVEDTLNPVPCGSHIIDVTSVDQVGPIACGSNPACPSVIIETGSLDYSFVVDKATVQITSTQTTSVVNGSNETITALFSIENTSTTIDLTSAVIVDAYYDVNNNGVLDAADVLLGTDTSQNDVLVGATIVDSITFSATPQQACRVLLVMTQLDNNCICADAITTMTPSSTLEGIAGDDKVVCASDSVVLGVANNIGYSYSWSGMTPEQTAYLVSTDTAQPTFTTTTPGVYTYELTVTRPDGCTSVDSVDVEVLATSTNEITYSGCQGDGHSVVVNGTTYNEGNPSGTEVLVNSLGCDSTVTVNLVFNAESTGDTTAVACDSFVWYGTTYTSSGTPTHTLTNAAGCDSVVTLNLTINSSNTGDTTAVACGLFEWYGTTYTSSGTPTHTLTNAAGCDSVVTLNLTINSANTGDTTAVACDSFEWYGTTYTSSGTPTHTLTNVAGCDSVVTLNLTINSSTTGDTTAVACDSFEWYGTTYTSSGTPTHTLTNAAGCDSVVTLNLTINNSTTGDTTAVACDSFVWYGTTYTSSGTPTHTLTNAAGCDSVVTLDLTINNSNVGTDVQVACNSFTWIDGNTYTSSNNSATYTLTTIAGCDSVVTLNLTINNSNTGTDTQVHCDSYTWIDGNTYTSSNNTATHTLTNAAGCDSVVTLNLTINYSSEDTVSYVGCLGDGYSVDVNGVTYNENNPFGTETLTNAIGCDSIVTVMLEFKSVSENSQCNLVIPEGFTPDGDGVNDAFVIEGIFNYPSNSLQVFNRWGNLVYETENYQNDWTGTMNKGIKVTGSDELPTGTYFYLFDTKDKSKGKDGVIQGYVFIKR